MFRKFPVASSLNESREELDYDGTKNCILEIENDLQQLRKKLKLVKTNSETTYGHDPGKFRSHSCFTINSSILARSSSSRRAPRLHITLNMNNFSRWADCNVPLSSLFGIKPSHDMGYLYEACDQISDFCHQ